MGNFYPRSPCGERRKITITVDEGTLISIHALLAESDMIRLRSCNAKPNFYPRSPCGERRRGGDSCYLDNIISIHALLAESDCFYRFSWSSYLYFYPRSPCGERPYIMTTIICTASFLSTLSLRRATNTPIKAYNIIKISIHALLAESD